MEILFCVAASFYRKDTNEVGVSQPLLGCKYVLRTFTVLYVLPLVTQKSKDAVFWLVVAYCMQQMLHSFNASLSHLGLKPGFNMLALLIGWLHYHSAFILIPCILVLEYLLVQEM